MPSAVVSSLENVKEDEKVSPYENRL